MKLLSVLLLSALAIGCGGYSSHSMTGGAPNITALSPNMMANSTAFTLTVTGTGLTTSSVIYWGTTPVTTNSGGYLSGTVSASISATLDANPGKVSVYVRTSAGNSNSLPFTVQ